MKTTLLIMGCVLTVLPIMAVQSEPAQQEPTVRFVPLEVWIDTTGYELGAFQFELKADTDNVEIVGIEGGTEAAFAHPPYYDPAALANNRVIIASYSTDEILPAGNIHIATLHLQITGDIQPEYELILTVAADANGNTIPATITFQQGD